MKKLAFLLLLFGLINSSFSQPQIVFEQVASGVSGIVDIVHANDSRLFIVDKAGIIRIMYPDYTFQQALFLDIRQKVQSGPSEMGLLGLAFHPDFNTNGTFFINYTNEEDETIVSRLQVDANNVTVADPSTEEVLIRVPQPFTNHNAGDIAFGPDKYLYITMGDGGAGGDPGNRSQDSLNLLGKILRIDVDTTESYKIPKDNPFINDPSVANEIWSIGWRNPWRFSFDRETGDMWIADVGQNRFEEVNVEAPGAGGLNYGWRCYEGPNTFNTTQKCISSTNYVDPVFSYDHLTGLGGSITGGFVYRGSEYPNLVGNYVVGDYKSGNVWTLFPDGTGAYTSTFWGKIFGRNQLSTFGENFAGEIFAGEITAGRLYKLVDTSAVSTTSVSDSDINDLLQVSINLVKETLTLRLTDRGFIQPEVSLVSMEGKVLRPGVNYGNSKIEISTRGLSKGLYVLKLDNQGELFVKKVLLK